MFKKSFGHHKQNSENCPFFDVTCKNYLSGQSGEKQVLWIISLFWGGFVKEESKLALTWSPGFLISPEIAVTAESFQTSLFN